MNSEFPKQSTPSSQEVQPGDEFVEFVFVNGKRYKKYKRRVQKKRMLTKE